MIKVAISGSHGTGKTTMIEQVVQRAQAHGWPVKVVESPTRYIKALGRRYGMSNNMELDFQFEWMLMAEMRIRQWVAEREMQVYFEQPSLDDEFHTLLIGDRCLIDPLSYVRDNIERLREGKIKNSPDDLKCMEKLYDLGHHFTFNDVETFWDRVYYKPPHPDHPPVSDRDRLGDVGYQRAVDRQVSHHIHQARLRGVTVVNLDPDRDKAAEQVWADILALAPEKTAARKRRRSA